MPRRRPVGTGESVSGIRDDDRKAERVHWLNALQEHHKDACRHGRLQVRRKAGDGTVAPHVQLHGCHIAAGHLDFYQNKTTKEHYRSTRLQFGTAVIGSMGTIFEVRASIRAGAFPLDSRISRVQIAGSGGFLGFRPDTRGTVLFYVERSELGAGSPLGAYQRRLELANP
jgi:hypothetical protein